MLGLSFIKVLFLYKVLVYKSCFDPLGSDCFNNGWSISNRVEQCAGYSFIGRFGLGTSLTQTFTISSGSKFKFTLTIFKLDSWDYPESVYVYYDDKLLGSFTYSVLDGTYMCFNYLYPELQEEKAFTFSLSKGQTSVTLKLQDIFNEAIDNEAWGMRNIYLEVLDPCVDFFSECNYQGSLWRICAGNQTSLTREIPFTIKSIVILNGITVKMKDPKYFGGNTQTFTTHQPCLTDFQFPKYQKQS